MQHIKHFIHQHANTIMIVQLVAVILFFFGFMYLSYLHDNNQVIIREARHLLGGVLDAIEGR